jgi:hypothetical protein
MGRLLPPKETTTTTTKNDAASTPMSINANDHHGKYNPLSRRESGVLAVRRG